MYLLDTNVVSELRKAATNRANAGVVRWASGVAAPELFLSVITLMELEMGILAMERKDTKQRIMLRQWFDRQVVPSFEGRVLPIDVRIATQCANLHIPNRKSERDAFIAATALVHGMTVVTRNVADFKGANVSVFNPWADK